MRATTRAHVRWSNPSRRSESLRVVEARQALEQHRADRAVLEVVPDESEPVQLSLGLFTEPPA